MDTRSYVGIALDEPKRLARLNKGEGHQPSCKVWHDGSGCLAAVREIRYALAPVINIPNATVVGSARTHRLLSFPTWSTVTLTYLRS